MQWRLWRGRTSQDCRQCAIPSPADAIASNSGLVERVGELPQWGVLKSEIGRGTLVAGSKTESVTPSRGC